MEVRFVVWKKEIYYLNLGFVKSYLEISVHENKNSIFSLKYYRFLHDNSAWTIFLEILKMFK
jgi:hypothetical protein